MTEPLCPEYFTSRSLTRPFRSVVYVADAHGYAPGTGYEALTMSALAGYYLFSACSSLRTAHKIKIPAPASDMLMKYPGYAHLKNRK